MIFSYPKILVEEKIIRRDGKQGEARSRKEAKRKNKREMDEQRKQRKKESKRKEGVRGKKE